MSLDLGLVARLLAWRRGRAVRVASCRRVAISPAARLLCPIQLAGEDATLHALAWGAPGEALDLRFVPDPRARDDQRALFAWLGQALDAWMRDSVAAGHLPQLWLPSSAALTLLDVLVDRNRGQPEGDPGALLGARLAMLLRQSHLEGSQAVILATEAITAHWATGQQPGEDGHLGSLLTWLSPPAGRPLAEALAEAERVPMSTKTRPELDRDALEPALRAWGRARRAGDAARLAREAAQIQEALRATVAPIYAAMQQTIAALQHCGLPELPALSGLVARDLGYFKAVFQPADPEAAPRPALTIGSAAIALVTAEDALEQQAAALLHGDDVALAAARARGDAVRARLEAPQVERSGRKTTAAVVARSAQAISRLRPGDEVSLRGQPAFVFRVVSIAGEGGETRIALALKSGVRRVGELQPGLVDLVPPAPNLTAIAGTVGRMRMRLETPPWTHAAQLPAPRPHARPPADPLADVEALRAEGDP